MKCAECGSDDDVKAVSPDIDIKAVPLCVLCRVDVMGLLPLELSRFRKKKE